MTSKLTTSRHQLQVSLSSTFSIDINNEKVLPSLFELKDNDTIVVSKIAR